MYQYTDFDQQLLNERLAQFTDQIQRYLAGTFSDAEILPLRLQNGLYIQRYAPMFRIAVPYGLLASRQLRKLAEVTRKYDRGYAHVSTRQNFQLNWTALEDIPKALAELVSVEMHSIQTSGNCIRNTTTDQFAGVTPGEIADPRPTCELIRQWSTFHPEFAFLPRKFKIAVSALAEVDRAATAFHDIGVYIVKNDAGEIGYRILVGGGLGRTPVIGSFIRDFLPREDLLAYLESIVRVYNLHGRRDNKYKARIKILVRALTPEVFGQRVEAEFAQIREQHVADPELLARMDSVFTEPDYKELNNADLSEQFKADPTFANWYRHNTHDHKINGYRIVTLSLKRAGVAPGDITDDELEMVADLADQYSLGEIRNTHEQNMVLADVEQTDLYAIYQVLTKHNMARAHIGFVTDIICCPGGDYCSLANAKTIPISEASTRRLDDLDTVYNLGKIDLNISGCMNACGHHHAGHIGILGVDKKGAEFYQITLGGNSDHDASIGNILGPSFAANDVPDIIEEVLNTYLDLRTEGERFLDTYRRVGIQPFKERAYA